MFDSYMSNAWAAGTIVAVIAGIVGFFVVIRGNTFLAHAVPHGAFAGAAGATLIGLSPLLGLAVFAAAGALTIGVLQRRARADAVTALTLVTMLALGVLFVSRSRQYSAQMFALLFGQILGVSTADLTVMAILGGFCLLAVAVLYRPLLLASTLPDTAEARGVNPTVMTLLFGLLLAAATTTSVPIVGALLMFALLVGPPAAAHLMTHRPMTAILLSVAFTLGTVWGAIALAYITNLPTGFFVTTLGATLYLAGHLTARLRVHRPPPSARTATGRSPHRSQTSGIAQRPSG